MGSLANSFRVESDNGNYTRPVSAIQKWREPQRFGDAGGAGGLTPVG